MDRAAADRRPAGPQAASGAGETGAPHLRETGFGKAGDFADHLIDALTEQPPGISIRQDSDVQFTAELSGCCPLLFQIHSAFQIPPVQAQRLARGVGGVRPSI